MNNLEKVAHQWQLKVEGCIADVIREMEDSTSQKQFRFFAMGDDNRARLLNLRTLLIDEHLLLDDILRVVLAKYRKRTGQNSDRLGIRIANLTGPQALKVASEALSTGDENAWKAKERLKQLSALVTLGKLDYDNPAQIADDYFENLNRLKDKMKDASSLLSRRPYRWNPWR
jgi:hypothetical protein